MSEQQSKDLAYALVAYGATDAAQRERMAFLTGAEYGRADIEAARQQAIAEAFRKAAELCEVEEKRNVDAAGRFTDGSTPQQVRLYAASRLSAVGCKLEELAASRTPAPSEAHRLLAEPSDEISRTASIDAELRALGIDPHALAERGSTFVQSEIRAQALTEAAEHLRKRANHVDAISGPKREASAKIRYLNMLADDIESLAGQPPAAPVRTAAQERADVVAWLRSPGLGFDSGRQIAHIVECGEHEGASTRAGGEGRDGGT